MQVSHCGLMGLDSKVFSPARPGGTRTRVPALNRSVQHHWTTTSMAGFLASREVPDNGAAWEGFPGLEASHKQRGVPQGPQKAGLITAYVSEPPPQGVPPDDFPLSLPPSRPPGCHGSADCFPCFSPQTDVWGSAEDLVDSLFFPLNFFPRFFS